MKKMMVLTALMLVCASVYVFAQSADTALAETDTGLADTNTALADTNTALADTNTALAETDTGLAETNAALAETDTALAETNADLADTDTALAETAAPAPPAKPKIAVYVTGGKDVGENKALGTYILDALTASGRYTTIERSESFLAEIDNEQIAQRSGAIDDSQISRLGKQSGVSFVCVADITQALRGSQISARILDVETAEVVTMGVSTSPLKTMDDLRKVSADIAEAMFRKLYPDEYKALPIPEKKLKFGVRAAYNNSYVSKMNVTLYTDGGGGKMDSEDYNGKMGAGSGFEIGAVTLIGLTDNLAFNFSPGLIIRKPFVSDIAAINELAINIPAFLEWQLFDSPLRAVCGVQFEIPFSVKIKWKGEGAKDFNEDGGKRAGMDVGVALGASVHILRNIAADVKGCIGLREFAAGKEGSLNQISVGVSYLY